MIRSSRWLGRLGRGRIVFALGVAAFVAMGAVAMAAGDDRTATESLLREIEASPQKGAGGELVARSRAALERGASLRSSGDEAHAKLADRLARTWAEAARDVVRAAVVEESAATARRSATDAGALADRERALLEEAIAQSGRLRAQLASASREANEQPARTSAAAASSDAGTRAPAKATAPAKPSTTGADGGAR
ncbi:MAG: hypothetical protein BGO98_06630 [Myxococcales bacterium 68-20]|nr:MAG: hypothetical protein BGO98_06630 [Myxococcales bacterium 68-20]